MNNIEMIIYQLGDSECRIYKSQKSNLKVDFQTELHNFENEKEVNRCSSFANRIEPINDDGEFIGAPRIWHPTKNFPGLMTSRSFGDKYAHGLGVSFKPKVTVRKIHESDRFIVIGSDGLWEFIENK